MWSLFAFGATGAPMDNDGMATRAQARQKPDDSQAPTAPSAPEFNSRFSDTSAERQGLTRRDVQAFTIPSQRPDEPAWRNDAASEGGRANDARQGKVGYYAAREDAGLGGHGSLQISEALEPSIREGAQLGGTELRANAVDPVVSGPLQSIPTNGGTGQAEAQQAAYGARSAFASGVSGLW
jgi:hypothetical protein